MVQQYGILADLERCVGCYACEVACKQENGLSQGRSWIRVNILGPKKVKGQLCSEFVPLISVGCTLCNSRIRDGLEPACVVNCPTKALLFCDEAALLEALRSGKRYQICTLR